MHRALGAVLALAASVLLAAVPPGVLAGHSHAHGMAHGFALGHDHEDDLGWAIVSGESSSMSSMDALDSVEEMKDRFGDDFLYIRDGSERYVITDPDMIERAARASRSIRKYGKEIGTIARAQAKLALSQSRVGRPLSSRERRDLERRREAASERLERGVRRVHEEMREILDDAKSKRLAEPLD